MNPYSELSLPAPHYSTQAYKQKDSTHQAAAKRLRKESMARGNKYRKQTGNTEPNQSGIREAHTLNLIKLKRGK